MCIRPVSILCLFALLCLPFMVHAAQGDTVATNITADRMQYDAAGQQVVFSGNVHVTRPDFELWSVTLTAYLQKKDGAAVHGGAGGMGAGQIDHIVAETNVRMKAGMRTGTCGKAIYSMDNGRLRMEQSPVILDISNNNQIEGDVIVFHTRDGRSDVIGGVKAKFSTSDGGGLSLGVPETQNGQTGAPGAQ